MTKPENKAREFITHAAVLTEKGWPILGRSHADCFYTARNSGFEMSGKALAQGFVTNKGRYVTRADAYLIALEAGQIEKKAGDILISEYIWHENDGGKHKYDSIKGYYL